jgi:hypothetical protein
MMVQVGEWYEQCPSANYTPADCTDLCRPIGKHSIYNLTLPDSVYTFVVPSSSCY